MKLILNKAIYGQAFLKHRMLVKYVEEFQQPYKITKKLFRNFVCFIK